MILLDKLTQALPDAGGVLKRFAGEAIVLRVHPDVVRLAGELATRDADKLIASMPTAFFPADISWIEWRMDPDGYSEGGDMGIMYAGTPGVRAGNAVHYSWKDGHDTPWSAMDFAIDLEAGKMTPNVAQPGVDPIRASAAFHNSIKPFTLALLALVNSPKMVKRIPAKVEKLNRKRASLGRYTFHPHHTVRLNVDRSTFTVQEGHGGDGASRALHFVRAHLRLWNGSYILVRPHWRGDPAVGIRSTSYEVDRQHSRWQN